MKIKSFILIVLMSVIILGLMGIVFISFPDMEEISKQINQNQIHIPSSYEAASISKGTILLLLAVGVIGVLGISRKKKDIGNPDQRNEISIGPDHKNLNEDK